MNVLSPQQQTTVVSALVEGCSIRSTERLTDIHRDTIMRLGVRVGEGCRRLHDAMMRDLQVGVIELDEQWAFIGKKQKRVTREDSAEKGDCYLFIALDAVSKAVLSYIVGKRDGQHTLALATDLRSRILNRPQITSDGFAPYVPALDVAFDRDVDFAQLVKVYQGDPGHDAAHRYSPGRVIGAEKTVIWGRPDESKISTSYVEQFNLTTRMQMRRFTRLTNGFSKKLVNHRAAIALHLAHYNLCRVHETLRVTPAIQLGVTDHIWTVGELVDAALGAQPTPPPPTPVPPQRPTGMSAGKAKGDTHPAFGKKLRVIRGGKANSPRRMP
jgi:IS1 family transposase